MALLMALHMALHMASQIMAPDPMASSLLLMVSNLLDISHLNSLLTLSNLPIPNSQPTNLPTNNQPTHSHLHMVNNLPTLSSLSILKVLQLDLNRRPRGSVS